MDSYKFRGDRFEGIRYGIPAAGERLELLSALIEYEQKRDRKLKDKVLLGFVAQESGEVKIIVREYSKNYWMMPVKNRRTDYIIIQRPEFYQFHWNDRIIRKHNIFNTLDGLAKTKKEGYKIIMPMVLSESELPGTITVKSYKFIFFTNEIVKINYSFIRVRENRKVYESSINAQPNNRIPIPWDCKDQNGQLVEDGEYILSIKATFIHRYRPQKILYDTYKFYHQSEIKVE
jgi:hypothetical protein